MSNAYNDWKKDMETYTKFFKRGDKAFKGICYNNDYCTDGMNYEFCDLLVKDVVIHEQFRDSSGVQLLFTNENGELISMEQMIDNMKVIIVQAGSSVRSPDGTYDDDYEQTLYVFHNDWLMTDGKKLFVVDEHHINEWSEITEQEFVKINKKEG
jgi:hypothetical protein